MTITREEFASEFSDLAAEAGIEETCALDFPEYMELRNIESPRSFAEVDPYDLYFAFAPQVLELPEAHRHGLIMHEIGHVLCRDLPDGGTETDADRAAEDVFGVPIQYDMRFPGKGLQCVARSGRVCIGPVTGLDNRYQEHRMPNPFRIIRNRYPGKCQECGRTVGANEGHAVEVKPRKWVTFHKEHLPEEFLAPEAPAEPPYVEVTLGAGNKVEIRLKGSFAGPEIFGQYKAACRPCNARKVGDEWVNKIPLADAGPILDAMRQIEGLGMKADDAILEAFQDRSADVARRLQEAHARLVATEAMLAARGQALYDYQHSGVEWLSVQDSAILADDMGLGKQHAVDTKILTPHGWRRIGDLKVGDEVIGSSGKATKVTGVFPQGVKPSYRVRFSDHSSVEAGPEHLWTVAYWRGGRTLTEMTLTTDELRHRPMKGTLDLSKTKLFIPMLSSPSEFADQKPSPVPPYLLGQLIANGSLAHGTPSLSSHIKDWSLIKESLLAEQVTLGAVHVYGNVNRVHFPGIIDAIRALELDVKSAEKRIPRYMFTATPGERIAFLQGLMDGDGSISKTRCKVTYHTTSQPLSEGVQELVECLGGIASIREYDRSHENKPVEYQVRIRLPEGIAPFRVPRKLERYKPGKNAAPKRSVKSVEYVRDVESVCIAVGAEDRLYVTEHAILTHNTVQALIAAPQGDPILVVCPAVAKGVWVREAAKWRPDLRPVALKGRGSFRWPRAGEMVVVNYDILPGKMVKKGKYKVVEMDIPDPESNTVLIADEAHALKNKDAARTKKFGVLAKMAREAGGKTWLLTATPMLGKPPEFYSLLKTIDRIPFRSWNEYAQMMDGRKGRFGWEWGTDIDPEVSDRVADLMLRRIKTEVLKDLPAKRHQEITVDTLSASELKELDAIMGKWGAVLRKNQLPPFEELSAARAMLAKSKIPALVKIIEEYEEAGEPIVVFSDYLAPIDLLAQREGWAKITGETPNEKRAAIEEAFQRGELKGIAATIKAGGVAITLTHASNAIFNDLNWTPALNSQAEDRIYRIGQDRGVLITTLVADHALDRRLAEILTEKGERIEQSIDAARKGTESVVDPEYAAEMDRLAAALDLETRDLIDELGRYVTKQETYQAEVRAWEKGARAREEAKIERDWQSEIKKRARSRRVDIKPSDDETLRPPETAAERWAFEALQQLIALDYDRAQEKNKMGFNKPDSKLGRVLASRAAGDGLSDAEWVLVMSMLPKYWKQIGTPPTDGGPLYEETVEVSVRVPVKPKAKSRVSFSKVIGAKKSGDDERIVEVYVDGKLVGLLEPETEWEDVGITTASYKGVSTEWSFGSTYKDFGDNAEEREAGWQALMLGFPEEIPNIGTDLRTVKKDLREMIDAHFESDPEPPAPEPPPRREYESEDTGQLKMFNPHRNPPYSGYDKKYPSKALPKDTEKVAYRRKRDALNVFMDWHNNRMIIEDYGGETQKHSPESFDSINDEFEIKEPHRKVDTLAKAFWWVLVKSSDGKYYLEDIDLELLNRTSAVMYNQDNRQFELPPHFYEKQMLAEEFAHYEGLYPEEDDDEYVPF